MYSLVVGVTRAGWLIYLLLITDICTASYLVYARSQKNIIRSSWCQVSIGYWSTVYHFVLKYHKLLFSNNTAIQQIAFLSVQNSEIFLVE